jgi:hypothetical protein
MNSKKGYVYRLKLSENIIKQGYKEFDEMPFPTYNKAYNFVCEKWGSAILNDPLGLQIEKKKIGTDEWAFCMGA